MKIIKEVVEPIVTGAATTVIPVHVAQWVLNVVGAAPYSSLVLASTVPGVLGLVGLSWVMGKVVAKIPKAVEGLLKSLSL